MPRDSGAIIDCDSKTLVVPWFGCLSKAKRDLDDQVTCGDALV